MQLAEFTDQQIVAEYRRRFSVIDRLFGSAMSPPKFVTFIACELAAKTGSDTYLPCLALAATIYWEFLDDNRIQFGDSRYDWTLDAAKELANESLSYS